MLNSINYNYFPGISFSSLLDLEIHRLENHNIIKVRASLSFLNRFIVFIPLIICVLYVTLGSSVEIGLWTFDFWVMMFIPLYYLIWLLNFWFLSSMCFSDMERLVERVINK